MTKLGAGFLLEDHHVRTFAAAATRSTAATRIANRRSFALPTIVWTSRESSHSERKKPRDLAASRFAAIVSALAASVFPELANSASIFDEESGTTL